MKLHRKTLIAVTVIFLLSHSPGTSECSPPLSEANGGEAAPAAGPSRSWLSSVGGPAKDEAVGVAVDSLGNGYVVGRSRYNWGTPIRRHSGGKWDAFAVKLDSNGELLWSTFLGSPAVDNAVAVAVGASGVYVSGVSAATWGTPVRAHSGRYDAFVAKLSLDGILLWNTFLGASGVDAAAGIACDAAGNVYVTGGSSFTWGNPVREASWEGLLDAFAAKLNPDGSLAWNTFLGSSDYDVGLGLALDGSGNLLVSGTSKADWGTPVRARSGGDDAFVAKLTCTGGTLLWNTFLGSTGRDQAAGVAADTAGNTVVVGRSNAAWGTPIRAHSGGMNSFVAKVDTTGHLLWNTFLGAAEQGQHQYGNTSPFTKSGEGSDGAVGVVTDGQYNIYVAGTSYGTWGNPIIAHSTYGEDGYVAKLDTNGSLQWNTFMGGGSSIGMGIALGGQGNFYVSGILNTGELHPDAFLAKFY